MPSKKVKEAFKVFKKEVYRCVDLLSLRDWWLEIELVDDEEIQGSCETDHVGRSAVISMSENLDDKGLSDENVKNIARHEVLELLLAELFYMSTEGRQSWEDTSAASHRALNRLMQTDLFKEKN